MDTGTEAAFRGSWKASMQAAIAASFGRPAWWTLALAAFLVRGGILVILLPLVSLPAPAAVATTLRPTIEGLAFARQSVEGVLFVMVVLSLLVGLLGAAFLAGSWLDLALAREADDAEELEGIAQVARPSAWRALSIRLVAHLPTMVALAYAGVRLVVATYEDLLSPGDPAVPIALRVVSRAPEAIVVVVVAWLVGEVVGGIAVRRAGEGVSVRAALLGAVRELVDRRGLATFIATNLGVLATLILLVVVAGRAADRVRAYLHEQVDPTSLAAALLLLVAAWVLGLALLGAALAWRAIAWTVEAGARRGAATPQPSPLIEESSIA